MGDSDLSLVKGTLELLVLKSLARGGEMHGFEILEWIEEGSDAALVVEEGALYPALHRMEKRGLLTADWGVSPKGRRAKYYRLTPEGEASLVEQEDQWERYVRAVARLGRHGAPQEG